MSMRETHLVELVDHAGAPIGESTVYLAHQPPGLLHRAFSVLIVDTDRRLLLQRRAAAKTRFALRWANACCGHPLPGQPVGEAASQRLTEEMGVDSIALTEIGLYVYNAVDPASNRVEREYDHVLLGRVDAGWPVAFNRHEVAAAEWVEPDRLASDLARDPGSYVPWLAGVLNTWRASLGR
jgi:isopentenyl-diphosphate delta-isomerase